jgi:homoserine kinase type II
MAVKTQFSREDFLEILSGYDLGEFAAFHPITKGTVQSNFLLETSQARYVFRYYENRSLPSVLFESDLIKYLHDKGYPCPMAFMNRHGDYAGIYKEKPYVIFEYVDGEDQEFLSDYQMRQLIQKVAELHKLTQNYEPLYKDQRWNYGLELARELGQKAAQAINTPDSIEKLAWFEKELATIDLPEALPKGICHCDFHPSNVLFKDGEFRALIDFDDANYTVLIYDIATLIEPFVPAFDWDSWQNFEPDANVLDFSQARKFVQEYMRHRPLNEDEKQHLFDVYKLTIIFDSIWYFARGAADDFYEKRKIDALNRLGRKNFYKQIFA